MEPTTGLTITGKLVATLARWWATRNDEAFKRERDEMFRGWTAELARALDAQTSRVEKLGGELALEQRLHELSGSMEFWRVLDNYGYEAAREAIDERRRMLAWAAAGSVATGLTVAQMARVERTLRELDPADLRVLRRLAGLGLPETRTKEWLLDIDYRKRETFAYSCEAYSRIIARATNGAQRLTLAGEYGRNVHISEERVDPDEVASIVMEAASVRNGWKAILAKCAPARGQKRSPVIATTGQNP